MRTPVTTPEPMSHARLQTPSNNSWRDIALGSSDAAACEGFGLEHLIDLQRARQMGEMA
ncbi:MULTISPECIES: hypothetical protein [Sulfitobacter]|uniref:hypothetical protein n=1 Tax=Sulfitobacter TaxID=60136 RepID=UPI00230706DF|nr:MULTISPECIES: hypothetical protein [Sulfitobacter]MDF3383448.1 hypothetical protein [Sulfitobacter sp. Ks11]MDF3386866.1 hypothetical protein [Sulfitobacter sp. M85]MDF3390286.1 hypothetical protein [Sulfitobacter sp. Ks16]MDF3400923.1 hypothetical protein [Sulfitobacter sp. KE39]MDF3404344.1 hypothetical protein [Sulfitobacter sp. Ks35]